MNQIALLSGSSLGLLAVVFGAFGAHMLKKILSTNQLKSFETGVKYQIYHAIVLLILGFNLPLKTILERYMIYAFVIGTILFSFSIYGLVLSEAKHKKFRFLGPITPLGGLFMIVGWIILLINVFNYTN